MKKIFFLYLLLSLAVTAQVKTNPIQLKINRQTADLKIKQNEETFFTFQLKKDNYYSIAVEQKGIDVVITLKDKNGKQLVEKDSPNGKSGFEKIDFSPTADDVFTLSVKPLVELGNSQEGLYSVIVKSPPTKLKQFSYNQLVQDFEILKNAYIETKLGLWYNTYSEFESFCNVQKSKIKDKMTELEFYRIIAPITAFTKEGHSSIGNSDEQNLYNSQNRKYLPLLVKILNEKVYLLNDLANAEKTKGFQISKINGNSIETIMETFLSIEPADGFNKTSKYRWIEQSFSKYYARFFENSPNLFSIELLNPNTGEKRVYSNIHSMSFKEFQTFSQKIKETIPNYNFKEPSTIKIDADFETAILTVNSFDTSRYEGGRKGFRQYLENTFKTIAEQKIKHLIIDIRRNEGGEQGMEDHLLSYLVEKEYSKYKYVEIPAFTFSFLRFTDYKNETDALEKDLKPFFYQANDGRYLNIEGKFKSDKPKENRFKGDIFILIGGLTFSGGSEFAALAKNYTNAKFIGEETGGGYYGNTSGDFIYFNLPNTKLRGRIPLHKYLVEVNPNGIPFGRGLLPDYSVQPKIEEYLNGYDAEMEFTKRMIANGLK